jgi:hypothetical protein
MTEKEFTVFLDSYLVETILPTLKAKGGQYSTSEDRFHNFNQLAKLKLETKEKNLTDLCGKQIVCLYDQMRKREKEKIVGDNFFILMDELIKDIISYMFLLRGMFYEEELYQSKRDVTGDGSNHTFITDSVPSNFAREFVRDRT